MATGAASEEDGRSPVATPPRMFSLRIVNLDYYMAAPLPGMDDCYSHFQGRTVVEVPVVRIFGATTSGQKTCVHLHKAFPYLYVSYDEDLPQQVNQALAYVRRLGSALEKALKIASTVGAKRQRVHMCTLVRGRKYYGYYPNEQLFVKIILYYPQDVSRVSTLLLSGGIMNHKFQPYEAHFPYLLQILIDYNLYGMGHLHTTKLKFRSPLPGCHSGLSGAVKLVKSEFMHQNAASGARAVNPTFVSPNKSHVTERNSERPDASQPLDRSPGRMAKSTSICRAIEPKNSGSSESPLASLSQPDFWVHGSVPENWMWPILSLSAGKGPFSKQTTCELEVDTSVQDVLNRRELLFTPLEQTGPEIKLVQSLSPIWEEEFLRSGKDGPAGPVSSQLQPTARILQHTPSLEKAMRDALFQIVAAEAHQVNHAAGLQDFATESVQATASPGSIGEQTQNVEMKTKVSDVQMTASMDNAALGKGTSTIPIQQSLLQLTQLANGETAHVSSDSNRETSWAVNFKQSPDGLNEGLGNQLLFNGEKPDVQAALIDDDDETAVNEEAVKSHFTQRFQTQELDEEAAEFLRWLGTSQDSETGAAETNREEVAMSQLFSSPGMDSALLKAMADYESATEQECQAILDCASVIEDQEQDHREVNVTAGRPAQFQSDEEVDPRLAASTSAALGRHEEHIRKRKNDHRTTPARIPQTDGACDDDEMDNEIISDEQLSASKKARTDQSVAVEPSTHLDSKTTESSSRSGGWESKGSSVRDLMRRRRERKPRKGDMSCSPLSEDSRGDAGRRDAAQTSELQASGRKIGEARAPKAEQGRKPDSVALGKESARKGKTGSSRDQKHRWKSVRYSPLPLVTVKHDGHRMDNATQSQHEREAETSGCEPSDDPSIPEQSTSVKILRQSSSGSHSHHAGGDLGAADTFVVRKTGDDRDCGGGQEMSREALARDVQGEKWTSGGSPRRSPVDLSAVAEPTRLKALSVESESQEDFSEMRRTSLCGSYAQDDPVMASQAMVQSSGSVREALDFSSGMVSNDTSAMKPCSEKFAQGNCPSLELSEALPVEEVSKDSGPSVLVKRSAADGDGTFEASRDDEVLHPVEYHFTDISDDSQDSPGSKMGEWAEKHDWDADEAFFGEEGKAGVEGHGLQEESHPTRHFVDKFSDTLTGAGGPVATGLLVRGSDAAPESGSPAPSTSGPSSVRSITGKSISDGNEPYISGHAEDPSDVRPTLPASPQHSVETLPPFYQTPSDWNKNREHTEEKEQFTARSFNRYPGKKEIDRENSTAEALVHTAAHLPGVAPVKDRVEHSVARHGLERNPESQLMPIHAGGRVEQVVSLVCRNRPPEREHLLTSWREGICNTRKEGAVWYGNAKDVLEHPTVMAGLIFDVKSREPQHLKPFTFGVDNKRSKFEGAVRSRQYVRKENWNAEGHTDSVVGIPSHFKNDGTVLYLLSPAKSPPTLAAAREWLSSFQSAHFDESKKRPQVGGEQMFTMDVNTGKLVPLVEIGDGKYSQETSNTDGSQEDTDFERPASPKYDETHVLNLTRQPSAMLGSAYSQRKGAAHAEHPTKDSLGKQQGSQKGSLKPPLVPSSAQATGQQSKSLPKSDGDIGQPLKKPNNVGSEMSEGPHGKQPLVKADPKTPRQWRDVSQMTAAITTAGRSTPLSQAGFRDPASTGCGQQVTLMSIEVFAETRGELLPDPRYDAIGCVVLVLREDGGKQDSVNLTVILICDEDTYNTGRRVDALLGCEAIYLPDEMSLLKCFARLVRECDPDMLLGWEIQGYSLGLLAERAAHLGVGLLKQLSRIPPASKDAGETDIGVEEMADLFGKIPVEAKFKDEPIIDDEWGRTQGSGLHVGGRIILNLWRIMRGEVKLGIYSLEAIAEAVLKRRVPRVPWPTLTRWFRLGPGGGRFRCLEYFVDRARLNLQIMDQLDLVNRTAELARVFGIDFYSVFSRGSQFRVESMMARLAHTQNYILVSPTKQQVADQPAMECLPLVMEPESRFYTSPVIVLDFQSLYPSMIIAYNLCFSTCLGKLVPDNPKVLGVTRLAVRPGLLDGLKERMTITPNGVMFTPAEDRPGILPRLLQEILSTRIMVKKAMKKLPPEQRVLHRVLNARQFALKLIANVTYGYTAAGFSGRMPCAEIADSIVQCGRLTLERAIHLVNSHPRWGARVVYGDTDSMFVLMEGRTREEAHAVGQEIAAAVTETNPPPVTLKMEKVYHPCVLLTKKRYVGYSYETPGQAKPTFDAKGIETIRRDSCPAVAKTLEHSLRTLFETRDLSQVKQYLQRQWGKILSGRVSLQDFVFAKEVRLGTYSARAPVLPPAAIVASKAMAVDPRAEPRYAERIPYVVVHGEPGARLVDMVVDPLTLIDQPSLRLHDTYYITKQIIPACQRIFMLVGVDLKAWFAEMPRVYRPPVSKRVSSLGPVGARSVRWDPEAAKTKRRAAAGGGGLRHGTIDQYYLSRHCTVCGEFTRASQLLCGECANAPEAAAAFLLPGRASRLERELKHLQAICRHCGGGGFGEDESDACISLDCSVFYERRKVHREAQAAGAVAAELGYYPASLPELF